MKINYKEYVVIGNAGEEKKVITLYDYVFQGTAQDYAEYSDSFFQETNRFWYNHNRLSNDFEVWFREDPDDAAKHIENQVCVVTEFWDSEEEVWKRTVRMVKIIEE